MGFLSRFFFLPSNYKCQSTHRNTREGIKAIKAVYRYHKYIQKVHIWHTCHKRVFLCNRSAAVQQLMIIQSAFVSFHRHVNFSLDNKKTPDKLDGCFVCNSHNTVFSSKAICAQAVYFLHSTMPSVTCLQLSDVSVICHVIYFHFPIQLCFYSMSVSQAAQRRTILCIGRCENLGKFLV